MSRLENYFASRFGKLPAYRMSGPRYVGDRDGVVGFGCSCRVAAGAGLVVIVLLLALQMLLTVESEGVRTGSKPVSGFFWVNISRRTIFFSDVPQGGSTVTIVDPNFDEVFNFFFTKLSCGAYAVGSTERGFEASQNNMWRLA